MSKYSHSSIQQTVYYLPTNVLVWNLALGIKRRPTPCLETVAPKQMSPLIYALLCLGRTADTHSLLPETTLTENIYLVFPFGLLSLSSSLPTPLIIFYRCSLFSRFLRLALFCRKSHSMGWSRWSPAASASQDSRSVTPCNHFPISIPFYT